MKILQNKTKILDNAKISEGYYKITLQAPLISRIAQPGQFITLRISDNYRPLLRRPFSIHSVSGKNLEGAGRIEVLYEVVGPGTELLSQKEPGDYLDVLGPLGKGFSMFDTRYSILVGGGMGIAPLYFLAQRLIAGNTPASSAGRQYARRNTVILIGAKTKKELLCQKGFANLGCGVRISTDDGSAGFKGRVTDLLRIILRARHATERTTIYACGPKAMLYCVSLIAGRQNIAAEVSLEEYMACGLGVCAGCEVKTKQGYQSVCKHGPVFDSRFIKW